MYKLMVYYAGGGPPRATVTSATGGEALRLIQATLAEHDECENVVVTFDGVRLFAVDCKGNRLP